MTKIPFFPFPPWLVDPYPDQPRGRLRGGTVRSYALSFALTGQRLPVLVRLLPPGSARRLRLIDGENRLGASYFSERFLLVRKVDVTTDQQHFLFSAMANFGSDPHTHADVARMVRRLLTEGGMTQKEVAIALVKKISWVQGYARLSRLALEFWDRLDNPDFPKEEQIGFTVAKQIAAYSHDFQRKVWEEIRREGFTTQPAMRYIMRRAVEEGEAKLRPRSPSEDHDIIQNTIVLIATRLDMMKQMGLTAMREAFVNRDKEDYLDTQAKIMKLKRELNDFQAAFSNLSPEHAEEVTSID